MITYPVITVISWISCLSRMSTSPIPALNDRGIASNEVILSTRYKDTDLVCQWLFADWLALVPSTQLRALSKEIQPAVVSHKARIVGARTSVSFYCADFRKKGFISQAVAAGESTESGPYWLHCNQQTEYADTERVFLANSPKNYRSKGLCRTRPGSSSRTSTHVNAGTTACLELQMDPRLVELKAFMDEDDEEPPENIHIPDLFSLSLSITELGTDRKVQVNGMSSISMTIDSSKPSIYRVCGRQQTGHGNAVLRTLAV